MELSQAFNTYFNLVKPERQIRIHTGIGGKDLFDIAIEERIGFRRVYIGKKVPRFLRVAYKDIKKSVKGIYYRLVIIDKKFFDSELIKDLKTYTNT